MNLTTKLANNKAKSAKRVPADKWAIMSRSTQDLKALSLSSNALQKGDTLLEFQLPNATGETVSLADFNEDFLVLSFYRGGWCPYCNMELQALQAILPQLKESNTALVAISPETPDHSLSTSQKNELSFEVLSDVNNVYAKSIGLVFQLPEDLREVYQTFGIEVGKHNGNEDYELPMPGTYVINRNRKVIHSFVPEDYTERLDPEVILEVIRNA